MRSRWQGICLSAVACVSFARVCHAQTSSVTPEDEYRKAIKVSEDIRPLGDNPFGEQISLYNGGLSFSQTDVSLPGNGPTLQLSRTFQIEGRDEFFVAMLDHTFGDWEIDLPRIETVTANSGSLRSWQTSGTAQPDSVRNQRCTNFAAPPAVHFNGDALADDWTAYEWWNGYHLVVPGAGDQELLPRSSSNTLSPTMGGKTFSIVTKQHWEISCLAQTSSGEPGEAFFAVAPDGTKYWFDYLVYRSYSPLKKALGSGPGPGFASSRVAGPHPNVLPTNQLERRKAWMLVTRIEDRFGNALTYHYAAGRLTSIDATDGRQLTVAYDAGSPHVHQIILQPSAQSPAVPRTWTYTYSATAAQRPELTSVTLPDGHAWSFDLAGLVNAKLDFETGGSPGSCYVPSSPGNLGATFSGSITQPSGLVGNFTVKTMAHGRSGVIRDCWGVQRGPSIDGYAITPSLWYAFSLVSKQILGAGVPAQTTTYGYSAPNNSWSIDCPTTASCPSTVTTDVVDPEGHASRYTFSNRYDYTESLLQRTEYHSAGVTSAVLRSEGNQYALPTAGPWPSSIGSNLQGSKENPAQTTQLFPLNARTIIQDGDTYQWEAEAFDAYAQIIKTKRSNSISGQSPIEESTTYRNDPALWVLGLPLQVTNNTTGEVEATYTYTASNDTLLTRARFGQALMTYTFNGAGQLASFTDGNNYTTTLGSYKRGIPQAIGYPDSTSESLVVDDVGQITSITDQAAHTTSYAYDPVGRITGIIYPSGDAVAWYPKTFTYSFVTSAERGVPANHWKRTATTGSAQSITFFDALLRPILSDSDISGSVQSSTLVNYDAKGQQIFASYPSAAALTFSLGPSGAGSRSTYDALGRLTQLQQTSELGTLTSSTAYLAGARQQVTDPKGNVTTTSYQVFDSPSYDAVIQVQAPAGITQSIARDLYGNPTAIQQSGSFNGLSGNLTKTLVYDSYHRLCRTTEPESKSTVMHYDAANNLDWSAQGLDVTGAGCGQEQVTAAAKTSRTYDAMNRVLTIQPPAGTQSTSYSYDTRGHLTGAASGISSWSASYNTLGQVAGEALLLSGQSAWGLGYSYDAYGHVATVVYPGSPGESVVYAPDALGRASQVGSYATGLSYFPNGQVRQFTYGNGTLYVAEQNSRQLLSNFTYGRGGTPQLSEDLGYDPNGNITAVTDLAGSQRNKAFGYDAINRLTSAQATGLGINETYTYDPLNNLRSRVTGGQTLTYNYDATNKLTAMTQGASTVDSFQYDNRGNVINKSGANLIFDQKNQLTQIQGFDTYAYDAAGRRVMKSANSSSAPTYYFYSQAGQLMYQVDAVTQKSTNFLYLGSKLIARNQSYATHVLGTIDGVLVDGANNASLNGWACSSGMPQSITVEVFVGGASGGGGTRLLTTTTNVASEQAVATACQSTGTAYRFTIALTAAMRDQYGDAPIYVYGDSPVGAGNLALTHSGEFTVPAGLPHVAPSLSVPSTSATSSYTVSWGAVSGASSYTLQEQINGGAWATIQTGGATSKALSGKVNGAYGYKAQACNVSGCGPWSTVATTTVILPPAAPGSITIPATSSGSVAVSWATSSTATSYTLQHADYGVTGWTTVYSGGAIGWTQQETVTGQWIYQVQACNAGGCSAYTVSSSRVTVTIPPTSAPSLTAPPSSGTGSYTVSWSAVSGASSYALQEQFNGGGWTTIQATGATSDAISGRVDGTFWYRVQACNAGGCAGWSGTTNTVVTHPPTTAPSLTVPTSNISGSYTVSWSGVSLATAYTLQEQSNGGSWATVQTSGATSKAINGNASGSYGYRVQGCNAGGCGPWSSTQSVSVLRIPSTPGWPSLSAAGSRVTAHWTGSTDAVSYVLEYSLNGAMHTFYSGPSTVAVDMIPFGGQLAFHAKACNASGCSQWSQNSYITVAGSLDLRSSQPAMPISTKEVSGE